MFSSTFKKIAGSALENTRAGYRMLLRRRHGVTGPHGRPDAPWCNAVLRTQGEVDAAIDQVNSLGLPLCEDLPKNWDTLAALDVVLRNSRPAGRVLDAGAELYSMLLPWLALYGYRHLHGGNLVFERPIRRGPIIYEHCDITNTSYEDASFDVVTCLSVIEHGVDGRAYFREMSRVLKRGGVLVTSTDYFASPIDTQGKTAFGAPVHVFSRVEVEDLLASAAEFGLERKGTLDLACEQRVVHWSKHDLRYTFLTFTLTKVR